MSKLLLLNYFANCLIDVKEAFLIDFYTFRKKRKVTDNIWEWKNNSTKKGKAVLKDLCSVSNFYSKMARECS